MSHPAFTKHPTPSARREVSIAAAAILVIALICAMASHLITIDHFAGTYGISVGTNSNYCSIEAGHLPACEHAK